MTIRTCFVVGPIGPSGSDIRTHADWLLDGIIKPTFEQFFSDFEVVRSDKITSPGMIDNQMINHLIDAEVVIVDMSLHNANAFYEMGIRHMAGKPVVHMFLTGTEIPFDVKPYRAIEFNYKQFSDLNLAKMNLRLAVEEITSDGYKVDSPVVRAESYKKVSQSAEPSEIFFMSELESLKKEITDLKRLSNRRSLPRPVYSFESVGSRDVPPSIINLDHMAITGSFGPGADNFGELVSVVRSTFPEATFNQSAGKISVKIPRDDTATLEKAEELFRMNNAIKVSRAPIAGE